jgi:hypothetical protein
MQTSSRVPPRRNPETRKAHQLQFFLQILLPVILFSILLLVLGTMASMSGMQGGINHIAVWAHISTIFMVVLLIGSGIAALAILILSIYALAWVLSKLPEYSFIAQLYLQLFGSKIQTLADKASSPFIAIRSAWAGMKSIFDQKSSQSDNAEK